MVADALADVSETDVILIASGSIRGTELGPVVTLCSLKACIPNGDNLTKYSINGKQLRKIFSHILRIEIRDGEGECFQVNERVKVVYSEVQSKILSLTVDEIEVEDAQNYSITLQGYHIANSIANLGISYEELISIKSPKVVTTSTYQVLEEWLRQHPNISCHIEGRIVFES